MIAVQNVSTVASDAEVKNAARACAIQVNRDCAPAWEVPAVLIVFVTRGAPIPAGAWPILVFDNSDQQGALGYHSVGPDGLPYSRVFAATCKQYDVALSTVISHEILEALIDPHVDQWRAGYAVEVGDPVEADSYPISISGSDIGGEDDEMARRPRPPDPVDTVLVSNFALPAWWTPGSPGPWDFLHRTTGPFVLTPGGYAMTQNGTVWGDEVPEWKKLVKITDGSRTLRLIAGRAPESEPLRAELLSLDRAA